MKCVYIERNIFCDRSLGNGQRIREFFLKNGWGLTKDPKKADIAVFDACAVTDQWEEFSMRRIARVPKHIPVIVTGCLSSINPKRLSEIGNVVTVELKDMGKIDSITGADSGIEYIREPPIIAPLYRGEFGWRARLSLKKCMKELISKNTLYAIMSPSRLWYKDDFKRSYIGPFRITCSYGCLNNCTYCAIKMAQPKFRSRPMKHVIEELKAGISEGRSDFCLESADTGAYGQDIGSNISELLKAMLSEKGKFRLNIQTLNPRWFIKYHNELTRVFKENNERLGWVNIPVQSGSDRILKSMQRGHGRKELIDALEHLKAEVPSVKIKTFLVVGFPGEKSSDFRDTLDLINKIGFEHVIVTKYSDRPGTLASSFNEKVPEIVKEKRMNVIYNEICKKR